MSLKRLGVPSVGVKSSEFADTALLTWGILILVCFICHFYLIIIPMYANSSFTHPYLVISKSCMMVTTSSL